MFDLIITTWAELVIPIKCDAPNPLARYSSSLKEIVPSNI